VSSNHNAAFPIATVAIGIWSSFPEVGDLILSHFYKQCPFLVPLYIPQAEGTSDTDYFKSLGYLFENGEIEPRDKYLKRISGTIRLYAAIVSSMPPKGASPNHPHGITYGWMWLAKILNLPPKADYTATAIFEFLEVAGHSLLKQYHGQFWKLIHVLVRELVPKIEQITASSQSGPVVRLKSFLEKADRSRSMKIPEGYLSPGWWQSAGVSGIYGI
jgi:nucleoporin GLE1